MSADNPNVVFMGSPGFAVPSLDALIESGRFSPSLVVTQPDRIRGRGRHVSPTPVRAHALDHEIDTMVMSRRDYADGAARLAEHAPDVIAVVAFGIILKTDLLSAPLHGCVNVHASLLPRHRGVTPIQAAILEGDLETGCTTIRMDSGIDTGDVLMQSVEPIFDADTAGSLGGRLAVSGARLLVETLDGLFDGTLAGRTQPEDRATYSGKIEKLDGRIDWARDAREIWRRARAMTPSPGAFSFIGDRRVIVEECRVASGESGVGDPLPGTVYSVDPLTVACGEGALEIRRIKPQGKRAMPAGAFVAGRGVACGDRFN